MDSTLRFWENQLAFSLLHMLHKLCTVVNVVVNCNIISRLSALYVVLLLLLQIWKLVFCWIVNLHRNTTSYRDFLGEAKALRNCHYFLPLSSNSEYFHSLQSTFSAFSFWIRFLCLVYFIWNVAVRSTTMLYGLLFCTMSMYVSYPQ